jgi:hypothetical protein
MRGSASRHSATFTCGGSSRGHAPREGHCAAGSAALPRAHSSSCPATHVRRSRDRARGHFLLHRGRTADVSPLPSYSLRMTCVYPGCYREWVSQPASAEAARTGTRMPVAALAAVRRSGRRNVTPVLSAAEPAPRARSRLARGPSSRRSCFSAGPVAVMPRTAGNAAQVRRSSSNRGQSRTCRVSVHDRLAWRSRNVGGETVVLGSCTRDPHESGSARAPGWIAHLEVLEALRDRGGHRLCHLPGL